MSEQTLNINEVLTEDLPMDLYDDMDSSLDHTTLEDIGMSFEFETE